MKKNDENKGKHNDLEISSLSVLVLVTLVSFLCYVNTLHAGFVYDDQRAIKTNNDLRPTRSWWNLFYNDFWGTPLSHSGSHKSYRPLCVLTFRLNYLWGELDASGYHLINVVLHCIASCLFSWLCKTIYGQQQLMLAGGMLFGAHPIHTEAVAGVVGRADVGAGIFFLAALLSYHEASRRTGSTHLPWFTTCLVFTLFSLYTKEQGITVLGVCLVYEIIVISKCSLTKPMAALKKLIETGGSFRVIGLILWAVALIYTRLLVMGYSPPSFSPADNPAANCPDLVTRFLTFIYLPFCNLWLLVVPSNLSFDWSVEAIPLVDSVTRFENVCSIILYSALLSFLYYYLKHCFERDIILELDVNERPRKTRPVTRRNNLVLFDSLDLMLFSLACMIIPFIPATNLFFYVGFVLAERILYIPSIGFCLLVINGLNILLTYKNKYEKTITKSFLIFLVFLSARTFRRNFDWMSEESLYKSGLGTSPAKSWANLANIYNSQGRFIQAEEAYKVALHMRPNMGDTNYNLGILLQTQKRYEEAIEWYTKAINYRPTLVSAYLNLGILFRTMGRPKDALGVFRKGYNISDQGLKDPLAHQTSLTHLRDHTGRTYFDSGDPHKAIEIFHDALRRMPDDYDAVVSIYNMLGQCHSALNEKDVAERWYTKALSLKPDHVPALLTYAKHTNEVNPRKSERLLKKALSIDPSRTETHLIYATHLRLAGRHAEALATLNTAFEIDRNDSHVLNELSTIHREMKDYQEAKRYQVMLKKLKPTDASVRTNLGALHHILGEMKEASNEYVEALKIDPNDETLKANINKLNRLWNKSS